MKSFLQILLDFSEVWALLIPLFFVIGQKRKPAFLRPVIIYLWLALFLHGLIDSIMLLYKWLPPWLQSNNPLYNFTSVVRFICFSGFFLSLPQAGFRKLKKWLIVFFIVFFIVNFIFIEDFFNYNYFSGNLLALEAYLLLIYCLQYYLVELRDDSNVIFDRPDFWVVTGLAIYVVINFFIFLFYVPMLDFDEQLSVRMWDWHNVAFIIFCIFITKALYDTDRNKLAV